MSSWMVMGMSETLLTPRQLDNYVREREDTVLIGKHTTTPRNLHIPSNSNPEDVSCNARTDREGGWHPKRLSVYPPRYHDFCPQCVKRQYPEITVIELVRDE